MQQMASRPRSLADNGARDPDTATQQVFDALADTDSRLILGATETAMTAAEISEACSIPLSTTYRKIDRLVETPLLEERTRFDADGDHCSEYVASVESLSIEFDTSGAAVELDMNGADSLAGLLGGPAAASAD